MRRNTLTAFATAVAFICVALSATVARPTWAQAASVAANAPAPTQSAPKNAADSALDAKTNAVAAQLRCPVCQGVSIQDSPAELAQQMRGLVQEQLRAGKTPDEVKAYFVSKYGEWILLQPRAAGFNLLIYALPVLAVLGGLAVLVVAMRRWTKPAESPPPSEPVP